MRIKINSRRMHTDLTTTLKTTVPVSRASGTYSMSIRRLSRRSKPINHIICSSILRLTPTSNEIQIARTIRGSRPSLRHSAKTYSPRTNQTALRSTVHHRRIRSRRCRQSLTKARRSHSSSCRSGYRNSSTQVSSSTSKNR